MDFIIIVCDNVVGEVCFIWFGYLVIVYWGYVDLFVGEGLDDEKCEVFCKILYVIYQWLELFINLFVDKFEKILLQYIVCELLCVAVML